MKLEFSRQIFEKYTNYIKFYGRLVIPWGSTDRSTDMTELIVTFRKFTNAPKNSRTSPSPNLLTLFDQ